MTGGDGGHDLSSHTLTREGVQLLGRLQGIREGKAVFAADLGTTLAWGDEQARMVLVSAAEPSLESSNEFFNRLAYSRNRFR